MSKNNVSAQIDKFATSAQKVSDKYEHLGEKNKDKSFSDRQEIKKVLKIAIDNMLGFAKKLIPDSLNETEKKVVRNSTNSLNKIVENQQKLKDEAKATKVKLEKSTKELSPEIEKKMEK